MEANEFGKWLKRQMDEKHWNQSELARAVIRSGGQITSAQISRLLHNQRGIGEKSVKAIAIALEVDMAEAWRAAGFLPAEPRESTIEGELLYIFRKLPDEEQQDVIEFTRMRLRVVRERARTRRRQTT